MPIIPKYFINNILNNIQYYAKLYPIPFSKIRILRANQYCILFKVELFDGDHNNSTMLVYYVIVGQTVTIIPILYIYIAHLEDCMATHDRIQPC